MEDEKGRQNFIQNFFLDVYIGQAPEGMNYKEQLQYLSTIARKGIEVQGIALTQFPEALSISDLSNGNNEIARMFGVAMVPHDLHDVRNKCVIGVGGSPFEVPRGKITIPPQLPLTDEALKEQGIRSNGDIVYLRDWMFSGQIQGFVC